MPSQSHIRACLNDIENKLNWGPCEQWTNQDFELLVDEIFKETGTNLSITTLKRIWGKVDYQSKPSLTTLNVLAKYLGYEHWRNFQNQLQDGDEDSAAPKVIKPIWEFTINRKVAVIIVILIAISSLFFFIDRRQVFFKSEEVSFSSKKVSTGLPNSVVFEYDLSKVIADSFFLQQSWDPRRRVPISQSENTHTSFYYYPGYFHAKLMANDQIVKEHEVFVESDGWTGMIERFPEPIYINEFLTLNNQLSADLANFEPVKEVYQNKDFWMDYYYVKEMGEVDANDFEFRCKVRNNSELGSVCRESRVSLICSKGRYNIPISNSGCVSNLFAVFGDRYLNGKKEDLSGLGCDLSQWTEFKLQVVNKKFQLFINDTLVLSDSYKNDLGKIVGFKFKFNGVGEVDDISLTDELGTQVFQDSFEAL